MKYPSQTKTRIVKDAELQHFLRVKTDPGQSVAQHHKTLEFLSNFTEENPNYVDYELIGDNFDIKIDPTHTTLNRSRQTHHWFLFKWLFCIHN